MERETAIPMVNRLVALANTKTASKAESDPWTAHARVLQRICNGIAARVQKGDSANRAINKVARRWAGKTLKSGRPARLSEGTVRRVWFKFKKSGPEALKLGYVGNGKVPD